jgi:DNA-binding MarR family transcriptional regulator
MDRQLLKKQAQRIFAAVDSIEKSLEKDLIGAELDLTKPQLKTLMSISQNKCCTMSELGRLTGYPTSALTGIVDRMIKKRLVHRIRDKDDRRIVKVLPTKSGSVMAHEFRLKLIRHTSVILKKLDDQEREKMVSLVERIAGSFDSPA